MTTPHDRWMELAITEARRGLGRTHPNPAVGSVIVRNGKLLSTGFHQQAGGPHAEVVAIKNANGSVKGATLYATLEPCNHFGKTPPCTDAIIDAGIKTVVFASDDPNPIVQGRGVALLRKKGITVVPHVLKSQADLLNRPFFKLMTTGLPWVSLKAAITLDGKIATERGDSKWISSEASRELVHEMRNVVDAIIVGAGTVNADDPQLTTRLSDGLGRNAARVILDPALSVSPTARVFAPNARTILVCSAAHVSPKRRLAFERKGIEVWALVTETKTLAFPLRPLVKMLAKEGMLHLLLEGGAGVYGGFLQAQLVDEVALFLAPKLIGHSGITWSGALGIEQISKALELDAVQVDPVDDTNFLISGRVRYVSKVPRKRALASEK